MKDYNDAKFFIRNKFTAAIVEVIVENRFALSIEDIKKELEGAIKKASTIHGGCPMKERGRIHYSKRMVKRLNDAVSEVSE